MRAVESDSVKSARKAIDKLHKTCERASETRERTLHKQDKAECAWQAKSKIECTKCESETFEQTVHRKEQNRMCMAISTITCTAVPRVWHFSAFHLPVIVIVHGMWTGEYCHVLSWIHLHGSLQHECSYGVTFHVWYVSCPTCRLVNVSSKKFFRSFWNCFINMQEFCPKPLTL